MATLSDEWEVVIGLEVHVQLLTNTKLFCGCEPRFGDPPNTHTCPVCLGLPGSLPVLNERAVEYALSACLALGCVVDNRSIFARKNYFYPDLPKGYQISQYERPIGGPGRLDFEVDGEAKSCRITRIHMEEDAGKNVHGVGGDSIVDLNRAGTPLIEIVSEPDLRTPAEAGNYLRRLREIVMALGINDGNLEQGSFRADSNVSVRKRGASELGTRTELKNINSFRFVEEAIALEAQRQVALIESGGEVRQQTRGYNADKKETYTLRDKAGDTGYRYFPEPDLLPVQLAEEQINAVRERLVELPAAKRVRYVAELGLTAQAATVLTGHPKIAELFEQAAELAPPVKVANFIQAEVLRDVTTTGLTASLPVSAKQIGELVKLVEAGTISGKQAKEVYAELIGTDKAPADLVKEKGMEVLSDTSELEAIAQAVMADNPKQVEQYRGGKQTLMGFFVGQMMKRTKGSANPKMVNEIFKRLLEAS